MARAAIAEKSPNGDTLGEPAGTDGAAKAPGRRPGVQRRALIVLGPHRSGTSALTRVLSLSGAALPTHLLPAVDGLPNDGNSQAGFWESKTLMLLHEEALASAGSRWDDPFDMSPTWFQSADAEAYTHRLAEALAAEFGDAPLIVAKDPRISRLAPIWKATLQKLQVEANWVIAVRNPLDVAASLNHRDGFPQPKGLLLWLTYFLAAERHTRDEIRIFVSYADLLEDWRGVISQIGNRLGLSFSRRSHLAGAEIDDFLDLKLRHHTAAASEVAVREDVSGWVKDAFRWALQAAAGKPVDSIQLDDIHLAFHQASTAFGPLLAAAEYGSQKRLEEESRLIQEVKDLKRGLASRKDDLNRIKGELANMRQIADHRQKEITMLNVKKSEEIARAKAEKMLSLHIAAEREDKLDRALGDLRFEVRSIRDRLEVKTATHSVSKSSGVQLETRSMPTGRVKAIAFYLPQFHPIAENDQWWGKGFTEWTNVTRAKPCFTSHQQPLLPSELGFYDLRIPEVQIQQASLAREYGIAGFCYYYYWFHGRKLLERPLEGMLASGEPDFPFCLCWANENWTRRWDGEDEAILIAQEHSPESDARFIDDVLPALLDPRYIKRNGEPLLLVYRADLLADPLRTTSVWREAACAAGLPGLHLCAVWKVENPLPLGFDGLVEFPPHHFPHKRISDELEGATDDFEGEVFDYAAGVEAVEQLKERVFPVYRGVMSGWDNTPRRGEKAWIFVNNTAEVYGKWLKKVVRESAARRGEDDQFVFINAWNEWAEGATLEPSRMHGRSYLEATRSALESPIDSKTELGKLELRISDRLERLGEELERLGGELNELNSSLQETTGRVDQILSEHQTALQWLRHVDDDLAAKYAGLRSELADELTRLRARVDTGENRSRRIRELGIRVDGLQRLALSRLAESPSRRLWLGLDYGILGLILKYPIWLLSGRLRRGLSWWRQARRIFRTGLFDSDYYRNRYPDVRDSGIDPLYHYVRFGAAQGRDPNSFFCGGQYLESFPELAVSGQNPLIHYLAHSFQNAGPGFIGDPGEDGSDVGADPSDPSSGSVGDSESGEDQSRVESLAPHKELESLRWTLNQHQVEKRGPQTIPLLFVSHDAARAGSQIYLLEVIRSFSKMPELEIYLIICKGGELRADFEHFAHVFEVQGHSQSERCEESIIVDAVRAIGESPGVVICNTVATGNVAKALNDIKLPVISIIHELPTTIKTLGEHNLRDAIDSSEAVIVVSEFVKNALIESFDIPDDRLTVLVTGIAGWQPESEAGDGGARRRIFERYGLPDDAALILGCGSIHHRKGTDLFVQVARDVILDHGLDHAYFLWVGGDEQGPLFRSWCKHDIAASELPGRVLFAGQQDSTVDYYLAADAFLLTSREDPFPLVNLEALARGLPIVAFRGAGGAEEALADDAGILVPYLDTAEMARAVVRLLEAPRYRAEISQRALSRARERYRWDRFIGELRDLVAGYVAQPKRPPGTLSD